MVCWPILASPISLLREGKRKLQKLSPYEIIVENVAVYPYTLTLLHSERPKLYTILAFPSGIELSQEWSDTAAGISIQVVKEHYVLTLTLCSGRS